MRTGRGRALSAPPPAAASPRDRDPWFWSHYDVASIVLDHVPASCVARGRRVLDFGCGDGAATLGLALRAEADVLGLDLTRAFDHLPELARRNLGLSLPGNLSFVVANEGEALPVPAASIDLAFSWSVFEHVSDPRGSLEALHRVIKPGGFLFVQVDPLFYSPFGSHLQRLVKAPWAHLEMGDGEFLELALAAPNDIPLDEQDTLYRTNAFEEVRRHLVGEYKRLNRLKAEELLGMVRVAGFEILSSNTTCCDLDPPEALLATYPRELLLTRQVVLLARRK